MGRRKSTKKVSSTARRKKKNDTIGLDFIGGILIAIGVILLVILGFENTSSFALVLSEILGGSIRLFILFLKLLKEWCFYAYFQEQYIVLHMIDYLWQMRLQAL